MLPETQKPLIAPNGELAVVETAPPFDPRKFARTIRDVVKTIFKFWWLVILCVIIGGVGGWIYDQVNITPDQYEAAIVFNLEGGGGGGGSSELSGLASAFGVSTGGSGSSLFSGQNFIELFRSKKIGNRVMMTPVEIAGKKDLLINHYKNRSGSIRKTKNEEYLLKFTFPNKPLKEYSPVEISYLDMFRDYAANDLKIDNVDRKSSFMELSIETDSDTLSKVLVETWLHTMTDFYKENRSQKTLELLNLYQRRVDSVQVKLTGAERKLAATQDYSMYAITPSSRVNEQRQSQTSTYLSGLYLDALKNIDALRTSLIRESPLVMIIDEPTFPLPSTPYPKGRAIKLGIAFGIILSLVLVFLITTYQNMMKKLEATA